ncbi:MAG: isoprenyl transferase [Flavobacteriales bacterium]
MGIELTSKIPNHVAIIMDGNGRWAKQKGYDRIYGHSNGVEAVRESIKTARELKIEYLTLYAFSTENWNRPAEEISALMDLLVNTILNEVDELEAKGVRLKAIGNLNLLPEKCRVALENSIERTSTNKGLTLVLALSYSARWEITNAVKEIVKKGYDHNEITEELVSSYLNTAGIPEPELLIRTSGEQRISNFLLWQIAYTEFYFTEVHWPDFNRDEFVKAVFEYQNRERRFGKISEQLNA